LLAFDINITFTQGIDRISSRLRPLLEKIKLPPQLPVQKTSLPSQQYAAVYKKFEDMNLKDELLRGIYTYGFVIDN